MGSLIVAKDFQALTHAFSLMGNEADLLGLEFKPAEDFGRDEPLHQIEYLGVLLRADVGGLVLPGLKRVKYLAELQSFTTSFSRTETVPLRVLERLVGPLAFTSSVMRWGYLFLQNIYDVT